MIKRKVTYVNGSFCVSLPHQLCILVGVDKNTVMSVDFNQSKKQFTFTVIEK